MGFGSTLADIVFGPTKMGKIRQREDDEKIAAFLANPTSNIPADLNNPANALKLQDFIKQQEIKTGTENAFKELAPFMQPSMASKTMGKLPTQQEFVTDAAQWAQGQGIDSRYALPMINQLKEQGNFQAPAAVPKIENFSGMPFVVSGDKVSLAEGFTQPKKYETVNGILGEVTANGFVPLSGQPKPEVKAPRTGIQRIISGGNERDVLVNLETGEEIKQFGSGPRFSPRTTGETSGDGDSGRVGPGGKTPKSKVLPPSVVKLQQEAVDQLAISSNTEKDLTDIVDMLDSVDLGPVDNLTSKGLNYLGMSTDNSRTYGTLVATIEKLRNDSLKLNKGVQTDGDAVRAMNEIIANPNDKAYVKQRLQTIARANKRWADIQQGHIKNIRDNYDLEQLDVTGQRKPENVINPTQKSGVSALSDDDILKQLRGQ